MYLEGLKATFVVEKKDKKYRSSIAAINTQIVDMVLLYLNNIGIIEISKSGNYISTTKEFRDMMIENITPQLEKFEGKSVPKNETKMILQAGIMATIIHWHGKKYNHPIHKNILIPLVDVLIAINDHIIQSAKKIYEKSDTNFYKNPNNSKAV